MFGMNRAEVLGNLGADPIIRTTQDGKKMATFSVATKSSWKNPKTGEITEKTEWHNIVVFNDYFVKMTEQSAKKGTRVMCVGSMQTGKYTGKDGVER
jgi:single-strand DNA-binding protein